MDRDSPSVLARVSHWIWRQMRRISGGIWSGLRQLWKRLTGWLCPPLAMFVKALPLLALWLSIPLVVLGLSTLWQASISARELSARSYARATVEIPEPTGEPLILEVAYPTKLFLEDPDKGRAPLSVWLLRATPAPGPTPLPNALSAPQPTLTATPSSPSPSEPTPTLAYVVAFTPSAGVTFVDKGGSPARSQIVLTPAAFPITSAVVYIQPAVAADTSLPAAQLDVYVRRTDGGLNSTPVRLEMGLETAEEARWRHGIGVLAGTTPLIVALVTALVGFGVQQWNRLLEEEQRKQKLREEAFSKIDELPGLLGRDLSQGTRYYEELQPKINQLWNEPEIRDRLRDVWKKHAQIELQRTVELVQASQDIEQLAHQATKIGTSETVAALEWAYRTLDDDWKLRVRTLILNLSKQTEYSSLFTGTVIQEIQDKPWRAMVQAWPSLAPRRDLQSFVDADVARGIRFLGLEGNPFGTEHAETDPLLFICPVYPSWFADLRMTMPTVVIGVPGSGKTATALLLAHENLKGGGFFPVYWPLSPDVNTADDQLTRLAQTSSQTLLRYLAVRPRGFLERSMAGKAAIVRLLGHYAGVGGNLALLLHQAGLPQLGDGQKMLEIIEHLMKDVKFDATPNNSELPALLGEAYPEDFQQPGVLIDVQETASKGHTKELGEFLKVSLSLVNSLSRAGISAKIFLPQRIWESLSNASSLVSGEVIPLEWTPEDLADLLNKRLEQAKTKDGERFDQAGLRGPAASLELTDYLAQDTPGRMVQQGNNLLRHIGQRHGPLTIEDLDRILKRTAGK